MQLPHNDKSHVDPPKILDYLLNLGHPVGGSKAAYFMAFGFDVERWELLRDALVEHARTA